MTTGRINQVSVFFRVISNPFARLDESASVPLLRLTDFLVLPLSSNTPSNR